MGTELYDAYHEKIRLTGEQEACVNYSGDRTLVVKGLAGSGKSIVLQSLAKKLMSGCSDDKHNKVAVFTFSNTLSSAIREVLDAGSEKENYITVTTLSSYISHVYREMGAPELKISSGPSCDRMRKEAVQAALDRHKREFGPHKFHNLDLQFWLDEFDWMKNMNVAPSDMEYYLGLPRKGRSGRIRMSAADRGTAFQLYVFYDAAMKARGQGDWIDHAMYLVRHAGRIDDRLKFDHVLIDEAQDLSLTYMLAAMTFSRRDVVIAMDMNQRIFDQQWTLRQLGIETVTRRLTKSMRTTKQIDNLAESVRKHNETVPEEDGRMPRTVPEAEGPVPRLTYVKDAAAEKKYVADLVKAYLGQKPNISVGIIAGRNSQVRTYSSWMTDAGIPHEIIRKDTAFSMAKPGVKIVNVYNAKGLEFTRVIIPQFIEGNFPYYFQSDDEEEMQAFLTRSRNLVYVGMTRARYSLEITYSGENGSRFISEMDDGLYEFSGRPAVCLPGTAAAAGRKSSDELPPTAPVPGSRTDGRNRKGFIDWHGTEEDHYDNVLKYAKDRKTEEIRVQSGREVRKWVSGKLGDSRYGQIKSPDVVRLLAKEYIMLDRMYEALTFPEKNAHPELEPSQLWKDLWMASIGNVIDISGIRSQKKPALLEIFSEKIFHLDMPVSVRQHLQALQENRRYRRYFRECFSLAPGEKMQFWRWICHLRSGDAQKIKAFVEGYRKSLLLMAYYLYLSAQEGGEWIFLLEREWSVLSDLQRHFSEGTVRDPEYRRLVNPMCASPERSVFKELSGVMRVLLFHFSGGSKNREGDSWMIEELYAAIDEKRVAWEQIGSILPEQIKGQVEEGKLPDFPKPDVQGLSPDEKLFYLDHTILYQGKEENGETVFRSYRGILYFTDRKIMFRGSGNIDLLYDHIDRIVEYDVFPEILEVICNGRPNFFQIPETGTAYQILKLIANRDRRGQVRQKVPFTYEELVDKADLGACAFVFDYAAAGDMPEDLREKIKELSRKLRGLRKTTEQYPERKEEISLFLSYYIPETIRVVISYQRYREAGLDEQTVQSVYEKVTAAVEALDGALYKKIGDIYHLETMDTVARAEAVREILGQDGYVDPAYEINSDRRY